MPVANNSLQESKQQGATLIEVLVAIVVLGMGLLGLANLQATSMRFNDSAYLRSQATNIAHDIIDRIRANRTRALAGDYDGQVIATTPPACAAATLAGTTIAARDIEAWRAMMACMLPRGTGSITRNNSAFTVIIQWDDSRGQDPAQQFAVETDVGNL